MICSVIRGIQEVAYSGNINLFEFKTLPSTVETVSWVWSRAYPRIQSYKQSLGWSFALT